MKRKIFLCAIFIVLIIPFTCYASFIIELKNGSKYLTNQYWEEGDSIKFYLYGGIVTFKQDAIKTIRLSDQPYKWEEPASQKVDKVKKEEIKTEEKKAEPVVEKTKPLPPITEAEKSAFLREKEELEQGYKEVSDQYKLAKKNADKAGIEEANKRLIELKIKDSDLKKRIKERNNGSFPDWY
jgi:hypothetical protein